MDGYIRRNCRKKNDNKTNTFIMKDVNLLLGVTIWFHCFLGFFHNLLFLYLSLESGYRKVSIIIRKFRRRARAVWAAMHKAYI